MKTMLVLKREARQKLRPAYWTALFVCVLSYIIYGYLADISIPGLGVEIPFTLTNVLSMLMLTDSLLLQILRPIIISIPLYIFITAPLTVGKARYFLHGNDGDWNIRYLFSPFLTRDYFQIVRTMAMRFLMISIGPIVAVIVFFFSNIFIQESVGFLLAPPIAIYSIVVYYRHRVTPYLLADDPKMKFDESKYRNEETRGDPRLVGFFAVDFSFLTWYFFGVMFFIIGQFFFMPYHETAIALRYREFFPRKKDETDSPQENDSVHESNSMQNGNSELTAKPSLSLQSNAIKTVSCLLIFASVLLSLFPVGMARAYTVSTYTENEVIVTTEEELREAIREDISPIRIDTTIRLYNTIQIGWRQDIIIRGTGTIYVVENHHIGWTGRTTYHFYVEGRLTLQGDIRLTKDADLDYGGGVRVDGGDFIMDGGRIEYNRRNPRWHGGAVDVVRGHFIMNDGVIHGNSASAGGGVYIGSSQGSAFFTMNGGKIVENAAPDGGGAYIGLNGHFVMHGGLISNNRATGRYGGGGIAVSSFSTVSLVDGEISYNHAIASGGAIGRSRGRGSYENLSVGPNVLFRGNTADGEVSDRGNISIIDGSYSMRAGTARFPHINWYGENSRQGTHLINNHDIAFVSQSLTLQQMRLIFIGAILAGKGIMLLILKVLEKKRAKAQQEVDYVV